MIKMNRFPPLIMAGNFWYLHDVNSQSSPFSKEHGIYHTASDGKLGGGSGNEATIEVLRENPRTNSSLSSLKDAKQDEQKSAYNDWPVETKHFVTPCMQGLIGGVIKVTSGQMAVNASGHSFPPTTKPSCAD